VSLTNFSDPKSLDVAIHFVDVQLSALYVSHTYPAAARLVYFADAV